uniref:Myosin heavy chain, non-muscle n=1 Tax=Phallusia mammillata TaxID=59560 RepID=A0A6F9DKZ1_9ASCI|nr:myosin heavy chain, non-muscle [Phallusia mammillata]
MREPKVYSRRQSMDVEETSDIGKVLEEARQEICCLERKNNIMEDALSDLHKWLAGVDNSRRSEGNELNVPFGANVSAAMQTSIQGGDLDAVALSLENESLKKQLNSLKEITESLTGKVATLENDKSSRERSMLMDRLSSSSFVCKQFAQESESNVTQRRRQSIKCNDSATSILDSSTADELQRQLCDVLEKNVRWQTYNAEREHYVSTLLTKYNQTCASLQETRDKLARVTSNPDQLALEQRRYFDKLLVEARQELENQRSETLRAKTELSIIKGKITEEKDQLKAEVERWRGRYEEQREVVATLNANYESERRRSNNSLKESKEKQSQIQILQRQVQLFSEDFRAERKEKEVVETEKLMLKNKIEQLQYEMEILRKKPHMGFNEIIDNVDPFSDKDNYFSSAHEYIHDSPSRGRRAISPPKPFPRRRDRTPTDITSTEFTKIDKRPTRQAPAPPSSRYREVNRSPAVASESRKHNAKSNTTKKSRSAETTRRNVRKRTTEAETVLNCPTCGKSYDVTEHLQLLKHIDICGD